jgi:transcriptional regulator with XRE-family HTH domain
MLFLIVHMISDQVNISAITPYFGSVPPAKKTQPDQPASAGFPTRLAVIRKDRGMTQQLLAERVGIHVVQLRRYESGSSQPTLDVIRHLAVTLSVSSDALLFGSDERGPDAELRMQFEAVSKFDAEEKKATRAVLDGLILRHEAKRLSESGS